MAVDYGHTIGPLREALQTVNVVNPLASPGSSRIGRVRRGKSKARPARTAAPWAGNFAENRSNRELGGGAAQAVVDRGAEARRRGSARRRCAARPLRSASCSLSNRLAAASTRSPEALSVASPATAPKPISHSSRRAPRRRRAAAAWPAHNGCASWPGASIAAAVVRRARPRSIGPGRSRRGGPPVSATMVDSRPCAVGPPSTISGMRPPRLARTCSARVGLIRPLALAEGAASGRADRVEQVAHRRMGGRADRDRGEAGGDQRGDRRAVAQRQDERQRARPVALAPALRASSSKRGDFSGLADVADMDDQRIEARPALGLVDARDRLAIGRVGGEAVDGLGRHRDRLARRRSAAPPRRSPRVHKAGRGCFARSPRRAIAAVPAAQRSGARHDLHAARRRTEIPARSCRRGSPSCSTIASWSSAIVEGAGAVRRGRVRAAEPDRRRGRREMVARGRHHAAGLPGRPIAPMSRAAGARWPGRPNMAARACR